MYSANVVGMNTKDVSELVQGKVDEVREGVCSVKFEGEEIVVEGESEQVVGTVNRFDVSTIGELTAKVQRLIKKEMDAL